MSVTAARPEPVRPGLATTITEVRHRLDVIHTFFKGEPEWTLA